MLFAEFDGDPLGDLAIGHGLPIGDLAQHIPDRLAGFTALRGQGQLGDLWLFSGKIAIQSVLGLKQDRSIVLLHHGSLRRIEKIFLPLHPESHQGVVPGGKQKTAGGGMILRRINHAFLLNTPTDTSSNLRGTRPSAQRPRPSKARSALPSQEPTARRG